MKFEVYFVVKNCVCLPRIFICSRSSSVQRNDFFFADCCFANRTDLSSGSSLKPLMQTGPTRIIKTSKINLNIFCNVNYNNNIGDSKNDD